MLSVGRILGAMDVVLYQNAKADASRLALKGVLMTVASVASACTAFDPDAYDDHFEPLAKPQQPHQHAQHEQANQHGQQQPAQHNQHQHLQQNEQHEQRLGAQHDQQQHAQHSSFNNQQEQQQYAKRRRDVQLEQRKQRMQHQKETFWSHIRNLTEALEDIMIHYTLQCNQGASDFLTDIDPGLFSSRMQPILQLLTVLGEDLMYYPGRLAQQLLPDLSADEPAELIYEHMPPEWYTTPLRGPAGPQQVHAALDALLLLCQHAPLLPYILERARPHHMPSALGNCRYRCLGRRSNSFHAICLYSSVHSQASHMVLPSAPAQASPLDIVYGHIVSVLLLLQCYCQLGSSQELWVQAPYNSRCLHDIDEGWCDDVLPGTGEL